MTNKNAILLGVMILTALALDALLNNWTATLFLSRKLADLIEWMAFWR